MGSVASMASSPSLPLDSSTITVPPGVSITTFQPGDLTITFQPGVPITTLHPGALIITVQPGVSTTTPPSDSSTTSRPSGSSTTPLSSGNSTASVPSASSTATGSCHCTYSTSTAAGIGVGSAFAGVLVALVIGFLLFFKARRSDSKSRNSFSQAARPKAITLPAAIDRVDDALPQALTHAELAKEASQLETAIRNYLDNYIDWDGSPNSPRLDNGRLSELAGGLKIDWEQKLHNKGSRSATLRMFVARFLAARVDVTGDPASTLLPPEVMRTYQVVLAGRKKIPVKGPAVLAAPQHTWRAMTAYLVSMDYRSDVASIAPDHPLYEAVNREATNIREALAPLRCRRRGTEDRETDVLRELVGKAALLGLRMFSQRDFTESFWSQKFEVFPGVRQKPLLPGDIDIASWVTIREPQS